MNCQYCSEPIDPAWPFKTINGGADAMHGECYIRMLMGSVGHQLKACSCYGGTTEDPPGMTKHEAAHAAAIVYFANHQDGEAEG